MTSLLMAHGHPEARHYPVPMLWTETRIVRQRVNREFANQAVLTQMAVGSILSKEAGKAFNRRIKQLLEN
ncbi:tail protein [Ruegeria phage vB_RpoS-V16]|uniref:tail length tape measure protein n=1 Tax=Ruegeria phage vB_RpoS-V16 TaxID=2218618 RepID=UPI000DCADD03|nr:tail length tape measure protein [Ruegeria phage vB_RpoS-V16]AWY09488.1 tail protein [Ruegeria phage vB_RpoS-V16]